MKKLLILVMVLAMASLASATLQLSIDGSQTATEATIDMVPSGTVELDIWTNEAIGYLSYPAEGGYYFLVASTTLSTIDYLSGVTVVADTGVGVEHSVDAVGFLEGTGLLPAGTNGLAGFVVVLDLTAGIAAGTTLINGIIFHCEGPGDVTVELWGSDYVGATLVDSVVIHQVPEPVTIALLGLGGLLLRRRVA